MSMTNSMELLKKYKTRKDSDVTAGDKEEECEETTHSWSHESDSNCESDESEEEEEEEESNHGETLHLNKKRQHHQSSSHPNILVNMRKVRHRLKHAPQRPQTAHPNTPRRKKNNAFSAW
eukprot:79455_1